MIEVLLPLRNPTAVFSQTIDSLASQTYRDFTVLLSDNFSTSGLERISEAAARLTAAGLKARVIRPPWELGRVQHWNWLHHQSQAEWLKPLFVGDWLEPDCLAACSGTMAEYPQAGFVFFHFLSHCGSEADLCASAGLTGLIDPRDASRTAVLYGNYVGGPVNVLYSRAAFQVAGGHHTSLPLLADFDLYARLAMQVPTVIIPRVLGHFLMHANRFAKKGSGTQRESMNEEWVIEELLLRYEATCRAQEIPWGAYLGRQGKHVTGWLRERLAKRAHRWKHAWLAKKD